MLVARDVERHHGAQVVLGGVSLAVTPRARIGIVGPNGIGKSTWLRILAGLEPPDRGTVERSPATTTVGFLPQEPDAHAGETLRAYLARRTGVTEASDALDAATQAMGEDPDSIEAYGHALEHFLAIGGDDLDSRSGAVLAQVGLPADRLDVEVGHLSGGQAAARRWPPSSCPARTCCSWMSRPTTSTSPAWSSSSSSWGRRRRPSSPCRTTGPSSTRS